MSKFHIQSKSEYNQQYQASIANPKKFWGEIASNFTWFEKFSEVENCDLAQGQIEWFKNGKTNISYNCLDRHLEQLGDKTAIIWESNDPQEKSQKITYKELHQQVCQFANLLLARGVKVGDRVCLYLPMIPQSVVAMLACARIGAIHSVVFAGFSAKSLAGRIKDCGAKILITSDLLFRGDKEIALFEIAKEALAECDLVTDVILYLRSSKMPSCGNLKPLIWQEEVVKYPAANQALALNSQDPLFILYTSGSTGNPKGIVHSLGGYMVYAGYSFQNVFNYQQGDIHFCTADIGWITGHSYLVYGPLLNGATILMFEGVPTHPTPARFWQVIEKHKVNIFYTAPTAIRALMQKGDEFVLGHDLSSLKTLGSVGEPINEEAWHWYNEKVGKKKCPIVDTWWQTETGGILISSLAGVTDSKPSHAGLPLPGIVPILLDDAGNKILEKNKIGNLCFAQPWPSMACGVWGDREKFLTYFKKFTSDSPLCYAHSVSPRQMTGSTSSQEQGFGDEKDFASGWTPSFDGVTPSARSTMEGSGYYLAGDGAFQDEDGLYRIIGRTDDVIKVSGHRLGTAEIENAVNLHSKVSESAAIGLPHEVKGEGIYVFVILKSVKEIPKQVQDDSYSLGHPELVLGSLVLEKEILANIQKEIGAIARPEKIHFVSDLPKTRSGKIMRRILKKIVAGEEDLGDISTLVNPEVVQHLTNLKKCN